MSRTVTNDDIGIKILREPQGGGSSSPNGTRPIDILAIHGLGSHPDQTWTSKVDPNDEGKGYVNWLKDDGMLPEAVPNARVMRYGYQSNWFGTSAIETKLTTVAQRMLLALQGDREDDPSRPLIFIAHCYGGLLVLHALLTAFRHPDYYSDISESTVGIVFLGTPFRGAVGLSQSEMLQAALREYEPDQIQADTFQILQPGNEFLQHLLDEFGKTVLSNPGRPSIACFYEIKESDVGRVVGREERTTFVVDEGSGCLDVGPKTRKYSMWRNHFSINKFRHARDEDYLIVKRVIRDMARPRSQLPGETSNIEPLRSRTSSAPTYASRTNTFASTHSYNSDATETSRSNFPDTRMTELQQHQGPQSQPHPSQTPLKWLEQYEWLRKRSPEAVRLMELWTFLDRTNVQYDLLQPHERQKYNNSRLFDLPHVPSFWPSWVGILCNRDRFSKALQLLWQHSFIHYDSETEQFSIPEEYHDSCFAVIQARGTQEVTAYWWLAARILGLNAPKDVYQSDYIRSNRRLVPHALQLHRRMKHCIFNTNNNVPDQVGAGATGHNKMTLLFLGHVLIFECKFKEAEYVLHQGCVLDSHFPTPYLESSSYSIRAELQLSLARVYHRQGMVSKAKSVGNDILDENMGQAKPRYLLEANILLTGIESSRRDANPDIRLLMFQYSTQYGDSINVKDKTQLEALNLIAHLDMENGRGEKALRGQRNIFNKLKESLGPTHLLTVEALESLTALLVKRGELDEAYKIQRDAPATCQSVFGKYHPDVLYTICCIGEHFYKQKIYLDAEIKLKEALQGYEKCGMHSAAQFVLLGLISICIHQGRNTEAEELAREVIEISNRHPDVRHDWRQEAETTLTELRKLNTGR